MRSHVYLVLGPIWVDCTGLMFEFAPLLQKLAFLCFYERTGPSIASF